jgi:hypothetical protein
MNNVYCITFLHKYPRKYTDHCYDGQGNIFKLQEGSDQHVLHDVLSQKGLPAQFAFYFGECLFKR